jgi:hypothetical protein
LYLQFGFAVAQAPRRGTPPRHGKEYATLPFTLRKKPTFKPPKLCRLETPNNPHHSKNAKGAQAFLPVRLRQSVSASL